MGNEQPMSVFQIVLYVANHWNEIQDAWAAFVVMGLAAVGALVTLASLITPLTSTPKDDEILAKLKNWLHQMSITNAKDVKGIGQAPVDNKSPHETKKGK